MSAHNLYADIYKCVDSNKVEYFTDYKCKPNESSELVDLSSPSVIKNLLSEEGYELFLDGKRIGFEPKWSLQKSLDHLKWYKSKNNKTLKSKAYFNGVLLVVSQD